MDSGIQRPPGTTFFICGLRWAHTNALATAECTNLPPAHPLLLPLDELDNKTKRTVSGADRPQRAAGYQLISRRVAGAKGEDRLPYFAGEQLSGLAKTDLDLDGMVHFKMALWDGACVHASVYKWDNVFTTWGRGRRNWTCAALWFHFGDITSLGRTPEPTGEQFSLPITARSSWLDCSIAVILLASRTQAKARSFYKEFLTCSCWTGTIWGRSILGIYTCVLSVFMCTLDTFTWPLQGRCITPVHSSHLTTSISQAALGEKTTDTELIIT